MSTTIPPDADRALAPPRPPGKRANIQHALKWLRDAGLLSVIDPGNGYRCNTFQLVIPQPRQPARQRPPADHRLRAFDERAAAWNPQRRRVWRAIWQTVLSVANPDGHFAGDIPHLTDATSDRLGYDVEDDTVAKMLRWSVASQLTTHVRQGRTDTYCIQV